MTLMLFFTIVAVIWIISGAAISAIFLGKGETKDVTLGQLLSEIAVGPLVVLATLFEVLYYGVYTILKRLSNITVYRHKR
jgi:hypothetical protein